MCFARGLAVPWAGPVTHVPLAVMGRPHSNVAQGPRLHINGAGSNLENEARVELLEILTIRRRRRLTAEPGSAVPLPTFRAPRLSGHMLCPATVCRCPCNLQC